MVNLRIVSKIIGQLLFLEATLMVVCVVTAFAYGEDDSMAFLIATIFTVGGGMVFKYLGRGAANNLGRREAYIVVTATWMVFSLFGMMPFVIGGYITNITDAFFETMSGFTTTGATVINNVETLPHGILVWRSLTHWIGGLGIVFFTIAVLPSLVGGSIRVFAAEATGPMTAKMHPRLSTNAKWILSVYLFLTVACLLSFYGAGMGWFDSVNYSMSTVATGGFSPHNDSVMHFHSPAIEYVAVIFQFLAGINFTLLYVAVFKRRVYDLFRSSEFRFYCASVVVATVAIVALLTAQGGYSAERIFRDALFQVVSSITTTGLFNDNAAQWPHLTWVVLSVCMFMGACGGSTSGGFKSVRCVMVLKLIQNEFKRILHPNAVLPVKIDGQTVSPGRVLTLLSFFAIFVVMCLVSVAIMIAAGVDNTNAVTIAISCMSNVGLTLGTEIGPVMSWEALPDGVKWVCSFLMLAGRLEIMSVLVLFTPAFWRDN